MQARPGPAALIVVIVMLLGAASGCKHEVDGAALDAQLFREATDTGYTYYVGTDTITAPADNSPHGNMRVRFNAFARSVLDSTGKLPVGGSFPNGSIIVKDVYSGSSVDLYAVMKKDPASPLAGNGWLWAELGTDGSVIFSTGKMGDGCISCHSASGNRDLVRIFDLH